MSSLLDFRPSIQSLDDWDAVRSYLLQLRSDLFYRTFSPAEAVDLHYRATACRRALRLTQCAVSELEAVEAIGTELRDGQTLDEIRSQLLNLFKCLPGWSKFQLRGKPEVQTVEPVRPHSSDPFSGRTIANVRVLRALKVENKASYVLRCEECGEEFVKIASNVKTLFKRGCGFVRCPSGCVNTQEVKDA